MKLKDFEREVLACVEKALGSFGQTVRVSIFYHIENDFSFPTEKAASEPHLFMQKLTKIFGVGARTIERMLVREIETTFHLTHGEGGRRFSTAVEVARRRWVERGKAEVRRTPAKKRPRPRSGGGEAGRPRITPKNRGEGGASGEPRSTRGLGGRR